MKMILSIVHPVVIVAAATVFFAAGGGALCRAEGAAQNSATPLLSGGNPDPTVCRVGDEYYIVTSSFSLSPGLPVYRSKDMVNWEIISHAWREPWPCKTPDDGIWAPTLRHHNGVFYLTVTWHDGFKKAENYLLTAKDPAGPWSKPLKIDADAGIDGSLFFDGDDAWYLSNRQPSKQKWRGHCQIWMQRIDLETGRLFGDRHVLTDGFGEGAAFAEGPHLYKIGGKYLLLHAQGGTAWGHMEIALVSDCVTGPYTHVAGNPVLTAKDWGRRSPLQAFGHADLVQMPDGEWRAVFLGMRMADEGKKCPLGRETFSCRVDLDDNGLPTRFRRKGLIAGDWTDHAATRYSLLDRPGDPVRYIKVRDLSARVDYPDKPFRFCAALAADAQRAGHIPDDCRPKAWWFFGQTETTHEGITADAEAMKRVGFGGVVYYDQYHGENPNAEKLWSEEWWDGVEFAASEASRLGLTFETAVGNGYVAGGPWIDPAHAMKTLVVIDRDTNGGKVTLPLPVAKDRGWQKTVAVLAIPLPEAGGMFVDMEYAGHEKGLASTMQHPGGMYGYREKTFKAVTNSLPKIPRWQAKTAAVVDFVTRGDTPVCIDPKTIRDVTEKFDESDRRLKCELPAGRWKVLRFVAVPTGGRTKHGRPEAMGLECDKMSVAAAELHWKSYTKRIIDRLKSKGIPLAGIVMDSHEAGAQNWTDDMLEEFARRRGYDFRPYLPLMAGYCVAPNAEDVLADFRRTCVELIAERYYGTFDRLCREEGLSFTAQTGGGMFMIADSVFSKKYVSIPEGEFWGYQKFGAYDVKDASSAAHLYGKKIASAEAMTDAPYKMTIPELRRRCDLAFAFGVNAMTACAVPHMPKKDCGVKAPTGPREYGLNRSNPWWEDSRPFWDYIAFCSWMLRQGAPAPEALFYAGDDVPVKIIASKVPKALDGLDWDFATGDAAARMTKTAEAWTTPEGIRYGYVVDSEGRTLAGTPPARRLNLPHISRLLPSGEKLAFIANDTEHEVKVDLGGEPAVVIDPWTRCQTTESSVVIPPGQSRFVKGTSAADPVQTCESDVTSRVIRNDSWWNTVDGKPIYSNGGGCYFYEGRLYWYGCRYEEAERVRFDSSFQVDVGGLHTTFVGVTCYSSADLVNWRDEGIVYAGEGAESEAHGRWFGRVGVAAVPSEGKFVLAMQYMGGVLLAVADSPRGPFVFQEGVDMSASIGYRTTGDQSVFYDDIHGKGYLVFSTPHGRDKTYVAELGYRNGRAFVGAPRLVFAGHGREGNCMFMHRGKYYLCASDLYGWDGSRAYWMVADSPMGPYRKSSDGDMFLMRNAVEDYCHVSQTGFFVTVRGTEQETVVFCGDRWTQFADNGIGFNDWTPLSFDGDEPVFNSLSEWSLDAATGRWAVGSGNNYVRNGSFDADRRQIPIRHKPDQDFVSGWTVEPAGGFLNATNKTCDKAFVTGKFALNLPAPFPRRAFQIIEDIPNGNYMLRYWRDDGKGWQRHEESVCVTNGTHVVEFVATAPCRIDDVSLIAAQAGAGLPNEIVAGGKLRGGFTLVPVKCHPGAAQPFRPFFKSYDDGEAKVSVKQSASSCEAALREGFANPPPDMKIGCYYYWVNERVDEEGVKKDLKWMKENGITRAFLATDIRNRTRFENPWEGQQFGDCTFRSEKWWSCLRTAFKTAGELGIEMGVFNCPGWSQSGGPWVTKDDAQIAPDGTYPENGPCSPAATGYEVDKTNRAAVRRHFDAFVGDILRRIPPAERPTLTTVVIDSWERGRVVKPAGDPRKLSDIIAEEYMGELTRCAHENGLITWCEPYSHSRGGWDGDSVTYGAAADEVAAEFWAGEPKNERAKEINAALGAACLGGKNKIYAESFTAGSWTKHAKDDWSFASLKPYADKFFRKGVNATILHVVISQPGDETEPPVRPWFGMFFDRRSRNAAEMKKLVPYLRRCNFMLQQGRPADGRTDTRILPDGTRIRFTEQSLFEVVFPDGRTETWNPVSGK